MSRIPDYVNQYLSKLISLLNDAGECLETRNYHGCLIKLYRLIPSLEKKLREKYEKYLKTIEDLDKGFEKTRGLTWMITYQKKARLNRNILQPFARKLYADLYKDVVDSGVFDVRKLPPGLEDHDKGGGFEPQ